MNYNIQVLYILNIKQIKNNLFCDFELEINKCINKNFKKNLF